MLDLQGKERTLMLAGTMALKTVQKTPLEVIRERKGFLTVFKLPDISELKTHDAKIASNKFVKSTQEFVPL